VGLRIELGMTEHSSPVNNVMVDNPYRGVEILQSVEAGSRLSWAMVGAQWDPRPRDSAIYLYAMVGGQVVSPMEKLGDGYPVIEADVPGLPERNGGLASSVGIGSRLRLPFRGNLALTGEFDYHNLGRATYVTYPGLEGDYPNTHYTVTEGPVETWNVRFGFAVRLAPRR
jgi:hypothetical protein